MTDERTLRTADAYSARAERFDRETAPQLRAMSERLLDELALQAAGLVLDLGTGTGGLLPSVVRRARGTRVVGIDVAEGMLAVAAEKRTPARLVVADIHALPLRDGCADVAVFSFVLHRVLDPSAALRAARRVLRPGGRVGIVSWGPRPSEPADTLGRVANHALVDTPQKLAGLLEGAGFAVRSSRPESRSGSSVVYAFGEVPR